MTTTELDTLVERMVRVYYEMVDTDDLEGLVGLFATDAIYERPGYPTISGHQGLRNFYSSERVIESGKHTILTRVVRHPYVAVKGYFDGRLRTGGDVSLRFADFFVVGDDGRFIRRETFFFAPLV